MAFILFSDSLFNTTYKLLHLVHATDILHEKKSVTGVCCLALCCSLLMKGIRQVVVRMRSSLKVAMIAWSVSGSDVTRLSSL